MIAIFMAPPY